MLGPMVSCRLVTLLVCIELDSQAVHTTSSVGLYGFSLVHCDSSSLVAVSAGLHGSFTHRYLGPQPGSETQPKEHDIRNGVSKKGQPVYS